MSVRVKTNPLEPITVSGASSVSVPEVSADVFRGVFIPLVQDGNVKTHAWLGTQPNGTTTNAVLFKWDGGNSTFSVASSGGMYGDDCMAVNTLYRQFTVNFAVDNELINCAGHGFANDTKVWLTTDNGSGSSGVIPTGLVSSRNTAGGGTPYYVMSATTDTLKLSLTPHPSEVAVTFSSNGSGELYITSTGVPSFWIGPSQCIGGVGQFITPSGTGKYLAPFSGRPYNRFEFLIKAPAGYQADYSSVTTYSMNLGTYLANEAAADEETNGYHFYFLSAQRHDMANGGWMRVRFNNRPQHMRGPVADCVPEPGIAHASEGTFWDTETRLYYDTNQYWAPTELTGSHDVLFDRVRVFWDEPPHQITVTWDTIDNTVAQQVPFDSTTETDYDFTITNSAGSSVEGTLIASGFAGFTPQVRTSAGAAVTNPITIPASGTWQGKFRVRALSTLGGTEGYVPLGPVFVPTDQFNGTNQPNFSDSNIQNKIFPQRGPIDNHTYGAGVNIIEAV